MRFLLFISLVLVGLTSCSPKTAPTSNVHSNLPFWLPQLRDDVQKNDYRITIYFGDANLSGIWVVRQIEQSWRGIMMNEFGLKMFDFICTANQCELKNVVALANKWYIRKTIANDLQFILEIDNPAYKKGRKAYRNSDNDTLTITHKNQVLQRFPNGEMVMRNNKRNLTYTFKKMED